jgi:cell wall assembly regulator SMI1
MAKKKVGTVAASWKRIERWLKDNAPGWKPLRNGATAEQLAGAQTKLGFTLPADVRTTYQLHNGSRDDAQIFPCSDDISYYLLPLSEAVQDCKMMTELLEMGEFAGRRAKGGRGLRNEWWNARWFPFAGNGGGDHFCIDLAPAPGGHKGQVISMSHESGTRKLLAPSLREWLARLAGGLETGAYSFDEDEGIV